VISEHGAEGRAKDARDSYPNEVVCFKMRRVLSVIKQFSVAPCGGLSILRRTMLLTFAKALSIPIENADKLFTLD